MFFTKSLWSHVWITFFDAKSSNSQHERNSLFVLSHSTYKSHHQGRKKEKKSMRVRKKEREKKGMEGNGKKGGREGKEGGEKNKAAKTVTILSPPPQ